MDEYEKADRKKKEKMEVALLLESGLSFPEIFKTTYAEQEAIIEGRNFLNEKRNNQKGGNQSF